MESKQHCVICENTDITVLGIYRAVHQVFSGMNRVKCSSCGMVFATPMPSEEQLHQYNASYFDSAHGGKAESRIGTAFFSAIAGLRAHYVQLYINRKVIDVNSVLEIGPGPGFFANNWLTKRPGTQYYAIETDSSCYESLENTGVQLIDAAELENKKDTVDMVVMSHVLEHVSDPSGFILFSTSKLRSDGILFIEVPCRDWEHKSVDEPHLLFFDKGPMEKLLQKLGFYDIEVNYYGQEIKALQSQSSFDLKWRSLKSRLIALGIIFPFAGKSKGMEALADPLERAIISPFKAHKEANNPAWWLRVVAKKK